ncbi:serine/threonine-protein kinase [Kamptonema animale CS-326]|jgi:serine/threonine protein kinase|uniref:serine/threonine protein kinase n=1 Tax=Kamptonema animale TaxID=92934 RepID=UPI00232DC798|nr:serine/threonine-protein kinase [Kamptonema animale]MDB9511253.1 serine/threonine-protein kinase [Kamptonema animale CS-326]
MNLTPGTVLQDGKYRIDDILGIGGFGITYRATHTYLAQTVVLKTLNESLYQHPDFEKFQEQFVAEAKRLSWCQHPNIVRMLDFFEEAGLSFIVMDYIPGQTLAQLVESGQPLPETEALHYIRQIASALSTLHQSGLVHRDIKPENIIRRSGTGLVMLIDFGIAREFTSGMRQTHTSFLSPGYAPIEQYLFQGEGKKGDNFSSLNSSNSGLGKTQIANQLTPATDIYGLAATFYYLLAGEAPVAAPLRDRIPLFPLRQFQSQLSPAIEQTILRGLEMDARNRPQTVENWLAFLEAQQLLERKTKLAEKAELPVLPSSSFILFLFVFTAALAGWIGFDLARRYSGTIAMNKQFPGDRSLMLFENSLHPEFRSQDPSAPLFGEPSVQSRPTVSLQLHKPPKGNSENLTEQPNTASAPTIESSPTPVPKSFEPELEPELEPEPEPKPEQVESFTPEPEPEQAQPYTPEPQREFPSEAAIAPKPAPVPEVAPLPPEPPQPSEPPAAIAPPADAPLFPEAPLEPALEPSSQPEPEPELLPPSSEENSTDSSVRSQGPQDLVPTVPFPEPASN